MEQEETRPPGEEAGSSGPDGPSGQSTSQGRQCQCWQATAWRMMCRSEHILDLLAEWIEWDRRRVARETSHAISGGYDWRLKANAPTYAELERRRRLTSVHPCWTCKTQVEIVHPMPTWQFDRLPDLSWVRCDAHREVAA